MRAAYLALLVTLALTACQSASQSPNCTDHLYSYTDHENKAFLELHGGKSSSALSDFAKAGQSRLACASNESGKTQGMNAAYAAVDATGQAAAAKRLGMDEEARRLMTSAKRIAAEVLNYDGIPPAMRTSMQKLANE